MQNFNRDKSVFKHTCPICQYPNQFIERSAWEFCGVCGWEDDDSHLSPDDDDATGNPISYNQARKMWANGETLYPDYPNPNRKLRLYRKKVHAAH